jgi:hypothetical protein
VNRGVGVVLIILTIAAALFMGWSASVRKPYFNPALYEGSYPCTLGYDVATGPLDREVEHWFAGPLRAVNEPSLYLDRPPAQTTTIRFLLLPTPGKPVIVRIDDLYGERPRLTATRVVGQVVLVEGPNHLTRDLTRAEVRPIIDFIASSRVLDLPPDSCLAGADGFIFLIEPAGYRFINRWGVSEGVIHELGDMMYRLTGWPNGELGSRHPHARIGPGGQPWPRPDLHPASETGLAAGSDMSATTATP